VTTARAARTGRAATLTLALVVAASCGGGSVEPGHGGASGSPGTGGVGGDEVEPTRLGPVLDDLNGLTQQIVGKNRRLLDGLRFATARVARTLGDVSPADPAASGEGSRDSACVLGPIDGATFAYNSSSSAYEATDDPPGPAGSVSFRIYEVVDGVPNGETPIASLLLTCHGDVHAAHLTSTLHADGADILHTEGNASPDPSKDRDWFAISNLEGFLVGPNGDPRVGIGPSGEDFLSSVADQRLGSLEFVFGPTLAAHLQYEEQRSNETRYDVRLIGSYESVEFRFEANLVGTDGRFSGPGVLGGEQHVCCFDGPFDDATVSQASPSCRQGGEYEAIPLLDEELQAIQAAHDALTEMYLAVESAATAMGALAYASAKYVLHAPPDCDDLPEPDGNDCLSVPIELSTDPTYAPTFSAIYDELFCSRGCGVGICHADGDGGLLFRSKQQAYCALVDVAPSALCENDFMARVVPGDPDASLLVAKLGFEPPCGTPMPIGSRESNDLVTDEHRAQVVAWIAAGAEYNPMIVESNDNR
jgi:hypothetical protein